MLNEQTKLLVIHEFPSANLQPFLNPICKDTYNALPKIYGNNYRKKYQPTYKKQNQFQNYARQCCQQEYEGRNERVKTEVKKSQKISINQSLIEPKKYGCCDKKGCACKVPPSSFSTKTQKKPKRIFLPHLKVFHQQELNDAESRHKIYKSPNNSLHNSRLEDNNRSAKHLEQKQNRCRINSEECFIDTSMQTDKKHHASFQMFQPNISLDRSSDNQKGNKFDRYYQYLENVQEKTKDQLRSYQKKEKNSQGMQDQVYSISSITIKQDKSSTVFHKLNEKEELSRSQIKAKNKRSSKVYSVLQSGLFKIPQEEEYQQYLKNYSPMNPQFQLKSLVKQSNFHIANTNGQVYFGQIQNQKKHGKGITVSGKQIYQGDYQQNLKIRGYEKNTDGVYHGEFYNGKRHGNGKFTWYNGQVFDGQWKEGKKDGFGTWKSPKGDFYEGQWLNNRQSGHGYYVHMGGSKYKGQFKDFLKHGKGQEEFHNGDRYIGQYATGKPHGKGNYLWKNGDTFEGQFEQGSRNGYGKMKKKNGQTYEGFFQHDMKEGKGRQHYPSGEVFQGYFHLGERLKGKLKTKTGAIIEITD